MEAVFKSGRRWRILAVGRDPTIEGPNERLRRKSPNEANHQDRCNTNNISGLINMTGVVCPEKQTQIKPNRLDGRRRGEDATSRPLATRHERRRRRAERAKARERSHRPADRKDCGINHLRSIPKVSLAANEPKIEVDSVAPPEARGDDGP